jgi:hypothetical protein
MKRGARRFPARNKNNTLVEIKLGEIPIDNMSGDSLYGNGMSGLANRVPDCFTALSMQEKKQALIAMP